MSQDQPVKYARETLIFGGVTIACIGIGIACVPGALFTFGASMVFIGACWV